MLFNPKLLLGTPVVFMLSKGVLDISPEFIPKKVSQNEHYESVPGSGPWLTVFPIMPTWVSKNSLVHKPWFIPAMAGAPYVGVLVPKLLNWLVGKDWLVPVFMSE